MCVSAWVRESLHSECWWSAQSWSGWSPLPAHSRGDSRWTGPGETPTAGGIRNGNRSKMRDRKSENKQIQFAGMWVTWYKGQSCSSVWKKYSQAPQNQTSSSLGPPAPWRHTPEKPRRSAAARYPPDCPPATEKADGKHWRTDAEENSWETSWATSDLMEVRLFLPRGQTEVFLQHCAVLLRLLVIFFLGLLFQINKSNRKYLLKKYIYWKLGKHCIIQECLRKWRVRNDLIGRKGEAPIASGLRK